MATVFIPTPLRQYVEGQDTLEVNGQTVDEVLAQLVEGHSELRKHLYDEQGRLRRFVNIYLNDEDIRYLQKGDTKVEASDEVSIVPAIAGGARVENKMPGLTSEEAQRYSRHLMLPEVGVQGQERLKNSSVLCIGAGGLGSPMALYLAAAGVGRLGMVDFDVVEFSNLQRQIIHTTGDVGRSKLTSAREKLEAINPHVKVETHEVHLSSENALELFREYDVIADGTDNFPTRYLVNDACILTGKPNVYGSIFRFEGQASVFGVPGGPCYRCLYPEPPPPGLVPSCAEGGVLGILPGMVGTLQATEVIKLLLGIGRPLVGRLLLFDALELSFREVRLRPDPACPICGEHPTIDKLIDYEQFCGVGQPEEEEEVAEITVTQLHQELEGGRDLFILDVRNPYEIDICRIEGSVVIPLPELMNRVDELDPEQEMVVHCRSGARSAKAIQQLQGRGFSRMRNLKGGVLAWAKEVDPSLPIY